jgi:hypothetical protein
MSTLQVATIKSLDSANPGFVNSSGTEVGLLVKKWVNFNGQGTVSIRDDFGVSSITDNGTGTYTINFDGNMSNENYAPIVMGGGGGYNGFSIAFGSGDSDTSYLFTGSFEVNFRGSEGSGGGNRDPLTACVIITGDN